jgi:hypothetical protein
MAVSKRSPLAVQRNRRAASSNSLPRTSNSPPPWAKHTWSFACGAKGGSLPGFDELEAARIAELVADRRSCDKVGPLLRWAERTVECDPVLAQADLDQCLAHFRRTLPADLIGRHALFHIEWVLRGPWWSAVPVGDRRTRAEEQDRRLRAALEVIVAAGAVGQLNRILKVSFPAVRRRERGAPTPDRNEQARFHGVHDVERFATFVARSSEASRAVVRFAASLDG